VLEVAEPPRASVGAGRSAGGASRQRPDPLTLLAAMVSGARGRPVTTITARLLRGDPAAREREPQRGHPGAPEEDDA